MKKIVFVAAACLPGLLSAAVQEGFIALEKWDHAAFCSCTDLHPVQVVRADNNWQLLWELRAAGNFDELVVRGAPCTRSQLMLLETQRLLVRTEAGTLKTAVPILDSLTTVGLRNAAAATAEAMSRKPESGLRSFTAELEEEGFGDNAFSILFSHVLDGMIRNEFEWRKVVDATDGATVWSGCLWFSYPPAAAFRPGTNSLSLGRYSLCVNWADDDPAFTSRIYENDAQRFFRQVLANVPVDDAAAAVGRELCLFDGKRPTVPVIRHSGALAQQVRRLTRSVCEAFLRLADLERVRTRTGCENPPIPRCSVITKSCGGSPTESSQAESSACRTSSPIRRMPFRRTWPQSVFW